MKFKNPENILVKKQIGYYHYLYGIIESQKNLTLAEKKIWYKYLINYQHRVYRQRPIDNFVVDFYCF